MLHVSSVINFIMYKNVTYKKHYVQIMLHIKRYVYKKCYVKKFLCLIMLCLNFEIINFVTYSTNLFMY